MNKNTFTEEEMNTYFEYNKEEGNFTWKALPYRCSKAFLGRVAGTTPIFGRQEGPQIKALGKRVRVSSMVWYMETGKWPISYLYHKDGNPHNNHISNLTARNPQWARGVKINNNEVLVAILFKDGEWYVRVSNQHDLIGPFPDMGLAAKEMARISGELASE